VIGHSGCGKSTVLSMASGLNPITNGGIVLDGYHVTEAGPDRAVVFQAPSLMPWLSAYENVALPRPRSRDQLLAHPDYYAYREELLDFLEAYEGGANPEQHLLDAIAAKRQHSINQRSTSASEFPVQAVAAQE